MDDVGARALNDLEDLERRRHAEAPVGDLVGRDREIGDRAQANQPGCLGCAAPAGNDRGRWRRLRRRPDGVPAHGAGRPVELVEGIRHDQGPGERIAGGDHRSAEERLTELRGMPLLAAEVPGGGKVGGRHRRGRAEGVDAGAERPEREPLRRKRARQRLAVQPVARQLEPRAPAGGAVGLAADAAEPAHEGPVPAIRSSTSAPATAGALPAVAVRRPDRVLYQVRQQRAQLVRQSGRTVDEIALERERADRLGQVRRGAVGPVRGDGPGPQPVQERLRRRGPGRFGRGACADSRAWSSLPPVSAGGPKVRGARSCLSASRCSSAGLAARAIRTATFVALVPAGPVAALRQSEQQQATLKVLDRERLPDTVQGCAARAGPGARQGDRPDR